MYTKQAASDFKALFKEATGCTLTTVKDSASLTCNSSSRYICLGATNLETKLKLTLDERLETDGVQIVTKWNCVFVMSHSTRGVMYGAYELLTQLFNYERFSTTNYTIDTGVKNLPFMTFDIVDNPDIPLRIGTYGEVYGLYAKANTMRFNLQYHDIYLYDGKVQGSGYPPFHNTLEALDYYDLKTGIYNKDTHPKWFSKVISDSELANVYTNGYGDYKGKDAVQYYIRRLVQLCYTAHGDATEYDAMTTYAANSIIALLETNATQRIVTLTIEDNEEYCTCSSCAAVETKYGAKVASSLIFTNDVAAKVEEWMVANGDTRDVKIAFYAYHGHTEAPAKLVDGVYQPIDDKVKVRDNVAVFLAPDIESYAHGFNDPINADFMKTLRGWLACADNFGAWLYQDYYHNYFIPYNSYRAMADMYRVLKEIGTKWIFHQGAQSQNKPTAFGAVKLYLNAKLSWNVTLNTEELLDKFFAGQYGEGATAMRKFFDSQNAYLDSLGYTSYCKDYNTIYTYKNFSKGKIQEWYNYCQEALEAIEPLKTSNPTRYKVLYDNIMAETLSPWWMLLKFYGASDGYKLAGYATLDEAKTAFIEVAKDIGVNCWVQHGESIDDDLDNKGAGNGIPDLWEA